MSDTTHTREPHLWAAWIRLPGQRWRRIGTAATEQEATQITLRESERHDRCDILACRGDVNPNQARRP